MSAYKRRQAKQLLVHYFGLSMESVNSDNRVEIEDIVDLIVDAAVEEVKAEIKGALNGPEADRAKE